MTVTGVQSIGELKLRSRFNSFKDRLVSPFISLLLLTHIKPVHLTIAGALALTLGLVLSVLSARPLYFLIGLWGHVLLDSMDGPLARRQSNTSTSGTLLDISVDHLGIVTTSFFAAYFNYAHPTLVITYTLLYTAVIVLALIRNALSIPYRFLFRPRLYIYLALTIGYFTVYQLTQPLLILASLFLLLPTITGLLSLWRHKKIFPQTNAD